MMDSCWMCEEIFGPKKIEGTDVRELQTFKGYTVDFRLRQFRKVPLDAWPEFIEFDSPEGQELCAEMHEAATKVLDQRSEREPLRANNPLRPRHDEKLPPKLNEGTSMDKERILHRIAFIFNLLLERNRVQVLQDEGQYYMVSRIKGGYVVTFQDEHKDMVVVGRLIRKGAKYIPEAA